MTGGVRLRRLDGRHAGRTHPLTRDVTTVGSHAGSDLRVDDADPPLIAPRHAALIRDAAGLAVRHLDGASGTWVNGAQVRRERRLQPGDTLQFGEHGPTFRLEPDDTARAALPAAPSLLRRRRTLAALGVGVALGAAWLLRPGGGDTGTAGREALLARVDSLTAVLRAAEARESTLAVRLDETATAAAETRVRVASADARGGTLGELARQVDSLRGLQADLLRAAEFDAGSLVAAHRDAVALLLVEQADGSLVSGTAVAVRRSGDTSWVATSRHLVVDSAARTPRRIGLAFDGTAQVFEAVLVASDAEHDLALLRVVVRGGTPVISETAPSPPPGTPVAVITFPHGLIASAAEDWRVSGITASAFTASVTQATESRLVLDGYGSPGMSGSPVLTGTGSIVGIIFGGLPEAGRRIVLAVPGQALQQLLARAGAR